MNAKFLKVAGVKNMDEFYTKYPDEETFIAKCGAKIKKAYPGVKIPKDKAQFGELFSNLLGAGGQGLAGAAGSGGTGGASIMGGVTTGANNIFQNDTFKQPDVGPSSASNTGAIGSIMSLTGGNPVQKVFDVIGGFKAQKEKVAQANQNMQVMGHLENAKLANDEYEQLEIDNERRDSYVKPWDTIINPGELNKTFGVGTNVLKKGGTIKAQNGFLGNTGQEWEQFGQQMIGSGLNEMSKRLNFAPDDMGGQLGADVLGTLGSATGIPGMDMVGKVAGKFIGDALDRSDTKIKRYNNAANRSINNIIGIDVGKKIQGNFGGNLEEGGVIPKYGSGGDVQVYGEGGIKPISNNPYAGEMGMIQGPSHDNGGVNMSVFGTPIEAEGGEPIMKMQEGGSINTEENMVILGNLVTPTPAKKALETFTGTKLKGKKYKSIGKSIAEAERDINKSTDRNVEKASEYTPLNKLDKISLDSIKLNLDFNDKKQQKLAVARDVLSSLQEQQNMEEEYIARSGKKIYAQDVTSTTTKSTTKKPNVITSKEKQSYLDKGWIADPNNPNQLILKGRDPIPVDAIPGIPEEIETIVIQEGQPATEKRSLREAYDIALKKGWRDKNESFEKYAKRARKSPLYGTSGQEAIPEKTEEVVVQEEIEGIDAWEMPGIPDQILRIEDPTEVDPTKVDPDKKGINWLSGFNLKGTDAEDFNNAQLLPEVWAMANNKQEAVQAQKFNPRLKSMQDISMQDQKNLNTSTFRTLLKAGMDPGQAAAQKYQADMQVTGNEMRANQTNRDSIINSNLDVLNNADLKNLEIADRQYDRQAQAAANTKATDFETIKSMTDKRLKHNLENQTLRVMENLYNYRFDPAGRAQYRGPNVDFSEWEVAGNEPVNQDEYEYERNPTTGKLMRKSRTRTKDKDAPYNTTPYATAPYVGKNGYMVKKLKKYK